MKRELLKRALDTSNGFFSTQTEAVAVNPNIWDMRLREYVTKNIIVTPLAEQFDFRGPGVDYRVTIDEAPTAATATTTYALTETTDISIAAFATRYTTFTPTEYGSAYQLTRKEAVRAFFNVADRMVKKLGYKLAMQRDYNAVDCLHSYAANEIFVNSKTIASDIASTDTLDYTSVVNGRKTVENLFYTPKTLLINYTQKSHLLLNEDVFKANQFGTREAIETGYITNLFGLDVYASHSIPTVSNVAQAIVLGETGTGEKAFGWAIKRDPIIEKEYHARGRFWDIVAHEEWDFQMLHANAVCLISTYA